MLPVQSYYFETLHLNSTSRPALTIGRLAEAVESAVNDTVTVEAPAPAEHVESHKSQSMASASSEASEAPATNAGATVSNEGNAEKSNEVETPNMEGKENEGDKLSQTKAEMWKWKRAALTQSMSAV